MGVGVGGSTERLTLSLSPPGLSQNLTSIAPGQGGGGLTIEESLTELLSYAPGNDGIDREIDSDHLSIVGTFHHFSGLSNDIVKQNLGWKTVFVKIKSYSLTKTGLVA